jgi:hypothetical protein
MKGGKRRYRMRGGNFYGAAVDPQIGSAGLAYPAVENVAANSRTGALIPNDGSELKATQLGGRHRKGHKTRKTRKARKTRKVQKKSRRTRKMRGGATYQSAANVGAGYTGTGYAGIQNYVGYPANVPVAGGPTQGPDGVMKA